MLHNALHICNTVVVLRSFWRYFRYILLALVVVGVAGLGWYLYLDYPLYLDSTDPRSFPTISWNAVVDGRLMRSLERQAKKGETPPLSDKVIPVQAIQLSSDGYYENYGVRFVSLRDQDIKNNVYQNPESRPYQWVAFYQTKIAGETYYILVLQWQNNDGTTAYLPLILAENAVIWEGQVTKYYQEIVANPTPHYLAPISKYYRKEICVADMGKVNGYCDWRYRNEYRNYRYEELGRAWSETGLIPRWVGRYPLTFTRQYASWEHI